jgi:hypothetical protein
MSSLTITVESEDGNESVVLAPSKCRLSCVENIICHDMKVRVG